ncbi:MAG TPA: hypothetical protein VEK08_25865 [Planctomycetota bacterium]|nr:hypothetical protein [Planctomycetota bacterium]
MAAEDPANEMMPEVKPKPLPPINRQTVERVTQIIRREKDKGVKDDAIVRAMAKDLSEYDEHSRMLLRKIAAGGDIPDDFPPDIITDSNQTSPDVINLVVTVAPPNIQKKSLVRHIGKNWTVIMCHDNHYTLKLLE